MDWRRRHRWHGCQRGRSTRPSAPQVWDSRCPVLCAWASGTEAAAAAAKSRGAWKVPSGWPPAKRKCCCKNTAFWFGPVFRLFVFITSFIPCRDFGSLYLGNLTVAARAVTHSHQCACSIFVCPNNGMASCVWDTTHSCVCVAFLCVPTMEWLAVLGILLLPVCTVFLCVPPMEWLAVLGILLLPVCTVFLCVPTMAWLAVLGMLVIHTSVCAVFLCVPTMVWLAVFGILLIPTSVCSIFVCPNNSMAASVCDF